MRYEKVQIKKCVSKIDKWNPGKELPEGKFTYIDLSSIDKDEKVLNENIPEIYGKEAPSRARQKIRAGDILVSTVRPNLNGVAVLKQNYTQPTASTGYCILRPNDRINRNYLFYWLTSKHFVRDMVSKASGANYPAVSDKIIKESKIPLPPLPVQTRIARALDLADRHRRLLREELAAYDKLGESLFLEMFGDIREYEKQKLKLVTSFIDYRGQSPPKSEAGIPLLTAKNVKKGYLSISPEEYLLESEYENWMTRGYPKPNDVLFTTEAPLGNVCLLPIYEKVAIAQRIICIQPGPKLVSEYILYLIESVYFKFELTKRATGSTAKGIRSKELAKIPIPLPPLSLQTQFAARIQKLNALKAQTQATLAEADDLFNGLLQQAFRGELFG